MLATYQNVKSFIMIKPEELISTSFANACEEAAIDTESLKWCLLKQQSLVWIL